MSREARAAARARRDPRGAAPLLAGDVPGGRARDDRPRRCQAPARPAEALARTEVVTSEHRLVIVRRDNGGDLATLQLDGALPCLHTEEHRSADVLPLNEAVHAAFGLEVSVLRCVSDEPGDTHRPRRHLYVMEAHGEGEALPAGARWIASGDDGALRGERGTDWARPGWRDTVLAWVNRALARRGESPVTRIEQVRVWEFSQVLRLRNAESVFYFKARPPAGVAEVLVTRRLAARHPRWLPEIVALDEERCWLLMRDANGRELIEIADAPRWEEAAGAI